MWKNNKKERNGEMEIKRTIYKEWKIAVLALVVKYNFLINFLEFLVVE